MKKILAGVLVALVLVGAGVGGTLGVQRLVEGEADNRNVDYIYVDRTPAPQEIEIRQAFQKLLDDYNARQWQDVLTDFASSCRPASSVDALGASFVKTAPDPTWRFELRQFRVIEVHDKTAAVDDQVVLIDKAGTAAYGPDYGRQPFVTRFTFEDGRWRAC